MQAGVLCEILTVLSLLAHFCIDHITCAAILP
jgi:hypothetical protein